MPQLGESIAEATIIHILVKPGDLVNEDQPVMEVETSKATTTVNSPCRGQIHEISVQLNEAYPVGAHLGQITVSAETAREMGISDVPSAPTAQQPRIEAREIPTPTRVEPTVRGDFLELGELLRRLAGHRLEVVREARHRELLAAGIGIW